MKGTDTRTIHSVTLDCYCEQCCRTAVDWYEWRSSDQLNASGSRYWTADHARQDRASAQEDGLTLLVHQPSGYQVQP